MIYSSSVGRQCRGFIALLKQHACRLLKQPRSYPQAPQHLIIARKISPRTAPLNVLSFTQPPFGTLMPQSGRRPQHQKRKSAHACGMSALPPKADMDEPGCHVRFVPQADIGRCARPMSALTSTADIAACHFRTKCGSLRRLTRSTSSSTSVPRLPTPYTGQPALPFERQTGRTVIVGHFYETRRRYKAAPSL